MDHEPVLGPWDFRPGPPGRCAETLLGASGHAHEPVAVGHGDGESLAHVPNIDPRRAIRHGAQARGARCLGFGGRRRLRVEGGIGTRGSLRGSLQGSGGTRLPVGPPLGPLVELQLLALLTRALFLSLDARPRSVGHTTPPRRFRDLARITSTVPRPAVYPMSLWSYDLFPGSIACPRVHGLGGRTLTCGPDVRRDRAARRGCGFSR